MWSMETGVMTLAAGASITLVESKRPPRPTSSSSASAGVSREQEERSSRRDLEQRDGLARIGALAAREGVGELRLGDERAGEADALVEAHEMGRRIDVDALAGALQHRAHEGDGGALAVGARHMDRRRQAPVRIAERREQALGAAEREVDLLWMQREETRHEGVRGVPGPCAFIGRSGGCRGRRRLCEVLPRSRAPCACW